MIPNRRLKESNGTIQRDRLLLSYTAVLPEAPWFALIVVHGLSEHKGRYRLFQKDLAEAGCAVYAYDQRGFGRSDGLRTDVERYADYLLDLKEVIAFVRGCHPDLKIGLIGHSLGGLVSAAFCAAYPNHLDGLILSAPAYTVPPLHLFLRVAAFLMNYFMPHFPIRYPNDPGKLSHDPNVAVAFRKDPLVQSAATSRFYTEFCKMNRFLHKNADRICLPTLILQGSDDQIVTPKGARALLDRIGSRQKDLFWYEGFYHEPFNEIGRERVIADLIAWLKGHFSIGCL